MLDQMSGGRFELGVGRGISPYELAYCGVDFLEAPAMYTEALDVILAGLRGGRLTHRGRYYRYLDVPIELTPVQRPHPPLWQGVTSPEGAAAAAARGVSIVGTAPNTRMKEVVERYFETWEQEAGRHGADGRHPASRVRGRDGRRGDCRRARRLSDLVRQPDQSLASVQHGAHAVRRDARARAHDRRGDRRLAGDGARRGSAPSLGHRQQLFRRPLHVREPLVRAGEPLLALWSREVMPKFQRAGAGESERAESDRFGA